MPLGIDLRDRAAVVVGGAGGGIGTAVIDALARAGASVGVVTDLAEHAEESLGRLRAHPAPGAVALADVTDERALVDAIARLASELGPVDQLVNVVGGNRAGDYQRADDFDPLVFDAVVARNLRYAAIACREVARPLLAAGRPGSIVNVSSMAARGTPLLGAYASAKSGLEALSRTMALEWGPAGIRVNVVSVGTVRTPRTGMGHDGEAAQAIPLRRRGDPEEVAAVAAFLLSDLASYVTGQTLPVDGGIGLGHPGGQDLSRFVTRPDVRARFEG